MKAEIVDQGMFEKTAKKSVPVKSLTPGERYELYRHIKEVGSESRYEVECVKYVGKNFTICAEEFRSTYDRKAIFCKWGSSQPAWHCVPVAKK